MRDVIAIDPLPKWHAILTRKGKSPVELFLQTGLSVMLRSPQPLPLYAANYSFDTKQKPKSDRTEHANDVTDQLRIQIRIKRKRNCTARELSR